MTDIKNLMFDLGGVIMNIERMNAVHALKELGMRNVEDLLGDYGQKGPFLALEKGDIDAKEFYRQLKEYMPEGVSEMQITTAFNKFLTGIPEKRLRELQQLHNKYKIYLLSNTNPIMWDTFIKDEFRKDGHNMEFYFDGIVASFAVHAYKPDAKIFNIAAEQFGINPEETLFFDDSSANCQAAEKIGFKTCWVKPGTEFIEYIDSLGRFIYK